MVLFDQLRISEDGRRLYINAHINQAEYFSDTTIVGLYICLGNQIYDTKTIDPESNGCIYSKTYTPGEKEIHEVIEVNDENLIYNKTTFKDLLFVYIKCADVPEKECHTTIGDYVAGVTFDTGLLHQKVMDFTRDLADDCTIPKAFTDFILLWNAFKASIESCHYLAAIRYYNLMFGENSIHSNSTAKKCGCHG